jgi:hypothetical protein
MGKTSERLNDYQTQMSIYAEQHNMILASDVLDMIEQLQDDLKDDIEKVVEELEESEERYDDVSFAQLNEFGITLDYKYAEGKRDGVAESIKIVNQLAEEYKGGWIPCSERLPNKDEYLKHNGRFIVTDGNRTYVTHFDIYETQKFGVPQLNGFCEDNKVIAWMPLPAPYKEGCE